MKGRTRRKGDQSRKRHQSRKVYTIQTPAPFLLIDFVQFSVVFLTERQVAESGEAGAFFVLWPRPGSMILYMRPNVPTPRGILVRLSGADEVKAIEACPPLTPENAVRWTP